jgi:hypothetical protein
VWHQAASIRQRALQAAGIRQRAARQRTEEARSCERCICWNQKDQLSFFIFRYYFSLLRNYHFLLKPDILSFCSDTKVSFFWDQKPGREGHQASERAAVFCRGGPTLSHLLRVHAVPAGETHHGNHSHRDQTTINQAQTKSPQCVSFHSYSNARARAPPHILQADPTERALLYSSTGAGSKRGSEAVAPARNPDNTLDGIVMRIALSTGALLGAVCVYKFTLLMFLVLLN